MSTVLVTGATGRLGRALVPALISKGYRVRAVVRPGSKGNLPANVERFESDLSRGKLPPEAYGGVSSVVHLAALLGERPLPELLLHNADATRNLLANCPQGVDRIVLASSISVYGSSPGRVLDEDCRPSPDTAYGASKLAQEREAQKFAAGRSVLALRFGMIYGPGFEEGYFQVFDRLLRGKMVIIGGGKNSIPLVHVDDAVAALLLSIGCKATDFRAYNIVGEPATQYEVLRLASAALGVPVPHYSMPAIIASNALSLQRFLSSFNAAKKPGMTPDHIRQLSADRRFSASLAESELGFRARVKLAEGINQMARIYLASKGRA